MMLVSFLLPPSARADGCIIPETATKKIPAIPVQRAFISYRDKTERLIVQSSLDGEGERFAWILPVPSVPTLVETSTPGFLATLSLNTGPDIVHDVRNGSGGAITLAVLVAITVLVCSCVQKFSLGGFLVTIAVLAILSAIAVPNYLGVEGAPVVGRKDGGVRVEKSFVAGGYAIDALSVDSPASLEEWLAAHGFTGVGEEGAEIVAGLIRENWRFLAIEFTRTGDGFSRPDPLAVEFRTDKAVYPMRLTALAKSPVYLELIIASDQEGVVPGLEREFCDFLHPNGAVRGGASPTGFVGRDTRISLAHPSCGRELAPRDVLTQFAGVVSPEAMARDIEIQWRAPEPYRLRYYSPEAARWEARTEASLVWSIGAILLLAVVSIRKQERLAPDSRGWGGWAYRFGVRWRGRVFVAFGAVALLSLAVGEHRYYQLPRREVAISRFSRSKSPSQALNHLMGNLQTTATNPKEIEGLSLNAVENRIVEAIDSMTKSRHYWAKNAFTGEPIRRGDSPGDYQVLEDERGIVFRVYQKSGAPRDWVLRPR